MRSSPRSPGRPRASAVILYLLLAVGISAAVLRPIGSYDLWWHLATGRLILQQGAIPGQDPFSFTRGGTDWLDHGWLFQVLTYPLFEWGGWPLLLGMDLLLILASYSMVAWVIRREGLDVAATSLLILLSVAGARFRFNPRPELASFFLTALLCFLLLLSREKERSRWIYALALLFPVWANVHPGVILGAALVYLWLGAEWLSRRLGVGHHAPDLRRTLVGLASPFLILLNPGGWQLAVFPWRLRTIITSGHAPNLEWASPALDDFPLFYLSVGIGVLLLLAGCRRLDLPIVLACGAVAFLAFAHLRNIGFYFLLLPLALARPLAFLLGKTRITLPALRLLSAAAIVLVTLLFVQENAEAGRRGYLHKVAPVKAVDFIESHGIGARLFNDVKFGGYLIWRRFPEQRVFIDGRNEVYDPLMAEIFEALKSWEGWEALLGRYGIDAALLRRGQMKQVRYSPSQPGEAGEEDLRAFSAAYFQATRWALVYWDDQALLFVRRDAANATSLLEREYRYVNPDDASHLWTRVSRGEIDVRDVVREIDRKIEEDPECESARHLRSLFAELEGGSPPK